MTFKLPILVLAVMLRREFQPSRLDTAVMLSAIFMLGVLVIAVMLRRGFQPSRLGAALVAMISLASGVLFDDLSLVIFRQPTERD